MDRRASCPEAIWAAANYWHEYFEKFNGREPIGRFYTPHTYPIIEPSAAPAPSPVPAPAPKRKAKK